MRPTKTRPIRAPDLRGKATGSTIAGRSRASSWYRPRLRPLSIGYLQVPAGVDRDDRTRGMGQVGDRGHYSQRRVVGFDRALERALQLAKSGDASHLPGWCGPAPEA